MRKGWKGMLLRLLVASQFSFEVSRQGWPVTKSDQITAARNLLQER